MTNYFEAVNSKSCLKNSGVFVREDSEPELLFDFYKQQSKTIDLKAVDLMFNEWCDLLLSRYNIAVQGQLSKFKLLESFKQRYLDSERIPDYESENSFLNITTVRLHGLTPIPLEKFHHAIFNVTENRRDVTVELENFLDMIKKKRIHYVFLMHSFELLYRDCRKICDLIFKLYKLEPDYIHILLSADHINSGKILNRLKFQLQLTFFNVPYGESFIRETTGAVCIMDDMGAKNNKQQEIGLFVNQLNLQSLKDVYHAMQSSCQKVMVHIIKSFIEQNNLQSLQRLEEGRNQANMRESRRATRQRQVGGTHMDFDQLLSYCQRLFILHHSPLLKEHLTELEDHRVIRQDATGKKIECLVDLDCCLKFIQYTT